MKFLLGVLKGLKWPVKLLKGWLRRRRRKSDLERKCYRHARLNSPSNVGWLRREKKYVKKRKFYQKKANK